MSLPLFSKLCFIDLLTSVFLSVSQRGTTSISFSGGCSSLNGAHSSKKEFAPKGANSFLEEVTLLIKEGK